MNSEPACALSIERLRVREQQQTAGEVVALRVQVLRDRIDATTEVERVRKEKGCLFEQPFGDVERGQCNQSFSSPSMILLFDPMRCRPPRTPSLLLCRLRRERQVEQLLRVVRVLSRFGGLDAVAHVVEQLDRNLVQMRV